MSDSGTKKSQGEQDPDKQVKKKKKMSKKKKLAIALLILLALAAAIVGVVYAVGHHYYSKTNYMTDEEVAEQLAARRAAQEEAEAKEEEEEIDPELQAIQANLEQFASTEPITSDGSVYNVVLVGLDTTTEDFIGNSDSMILISINYRLKQISMISLMRDTYVDIPGIGYRKLNASYPNGAGPLLCETITENYKVQVDRYVTVDFGNMIDIIDAIGTIEITFTEKEAENANKSIRQQCRILGLNKKEYLIPGEGTYECNGMQAVAYARIRKVGNADYQRTERQREVLMKKIFLLLAACFVLLTVAVRADEVKTEYFTIELPPDWKQPRPARNIPGRGLTATFVTKDGKTAVNIAIVQTSLRAREFAAHAMERAMERDTFVTDAREISGGVAVEIFKDGHRGVIYYFSNGKQVSSIAIIGSIATGRELLQKHLKPADVGLFPALTE